MTIPECSGNIYLLLRANCCCISPPERVPDSLTTYCTEHFVDANSTPIHPRRKAPISLICKHLERHLQMDLVNQLVSHLLLHLNSNSLHPYLSGALEVLLWWLTPEKKA